MSRPDSAGRTPAMAASANGRLGCLSALVEGGDSDGEDVGTVAALAGTAAVAEEETAPAWERGTQTPREIVPARTKAWRKEGLESSGKGVVINAGIDTPDSEGRTALMHACMFDQVRCGVVWYGVVWVRGSGWVG